VSAKGPYPNPINTKKYAVYMPQQISPALFNFTVNSRRATAT
jgi:hypothetical protein